MSHPADKDTGGAPTWDPSYDAPMSGKEPAGYDEAEQNKELGPDEYAGFGEE